MEAVILEDLDGHYFSTMIVPTPPVMMIEVMIAQQFDPWTATVEDVSNAEIRKAVFHRTNECKILGKNESVATIYRQHNRPEVKR